MARDWMNCEDREDREELNMSPQPGQEESGFYGIGSTTPPREYRGVMVAVLILVLFFSSLTTILGLLNVHLFAQSVREQNQRCPVTAQPGQEQVPGSLEETQIEAASALLTSPGLGLRGRMVPSFSQYYYGLPAGWMVEEIQPDSPGDRAGLQVGDVLLAAGGLEISGEEVLDQEFGEGTEAGVEVRLWRDGAELELTIPAEE